LKDRNPAGKLTETLSQTRHTSPNLGDASGLLMVRTSFIELDFHYANGANSKHGSSCKTSSQCRGHNGCVAEQTTLACGGGRRSLMKAVEFESGFNHPVDEECVEASNWMCKISGD
jgi:hypothetical protein